MVAYIDDYNCISQNTHSTDINDPDPERLACADVLADRPDTHRTTAAQAAAGGAPKRITKEEVYTPAVACEMWSIFGSGASEMGYGLPAWVAPDRCRPRKARSGLN